MDILLVFFYTIIFSIIIFYSKLSSKTGLSKGFILSIFLIKCLCGILYTYIHIHQYGGGDTLNYFNDANIIYNTLWENPVKYLQLTFGSNGGNVPALIEQEVIDMGYWGDTSAYMVVRFNAIVHLFSLGNFYVHGIFMSFLSLMGLLLLWGTLIISKVNPSLLLKDSSKNYHNPLLQKRTTLKIAVFFIPSVLFWTSGVHKEGLLLLGLGGFFFFMTSFLKGWRWYHLAGLVLSSFLIYLVRDFFFFLLIPGCIAYIFSVKAERYAPVIFLAVYMIFLLGASHLYLFEGNNYLQMITVKQQQFKSLEAGNTNIHVSDFKPTLKGMATQLPQSLKNSFLGPLFIKKVSVLHIFAFLETILLILLLTASLFLTNYSNYRINPLMIWFFFFSLSMLVLIGYIVPNAGAIVRYRSVCLPFLFLFVLTNVEFPRKSQNLKI